MASSKLAFVLKPFALTLIVTSFTAAGLIAGVSVVIGEVRLAESASSNQWLAKDIAAQLADSGAQFVALANKYSALVRSDSGMFDSVATREFEADSRLRAIWVIEAGASLPIAKLERAGFNLSSANQPEIDASLVKLGEQTIQAGSGLLNLAPGLNVAGVKMGEGSRALFLFFDRALFSRASGGPRGEKWMIFYSPQGQAITNTVAMVAESQPETERSASSLDFPGLNEVQAAMVEENPAGQRTEIAKQIRLANGRAYQMNAIQTGTFGTIAVALSPIDKSFGFVDDLIPLAAGLCLVIAGIVASIQIARLRSRKNAVSA